MYNNYPHIPSSEMHLCAFASSSSVFLGSISYNQRRSSYPFRAAFSSVYPQHNLITPSANLRIAVVGAGTSGLTAACLLQQNGHHVSSFDCVPEPQVEKCGVMLRGNAIDDLIDAGLEGVADDIINVSVPLTKFFLKNLNGKHRGTGDPSPNGTDRLSRFARRSDIVHTLYKCFRDSPKTTSNESAFYGEKELTAVEQTEDEVMALFKDGSSWTGDLLVGCDGLRSVAAQYVAPERQFNFLGRRGWRGLAPDDSFATNGANVIFGPEEGFFANSYDVGEDQHGEPWSHWAILKTDISESEAADVKKRNGEVPKEVLDRLPAEFVSLVSKTPASEIVHSSSFDITPLPRYVRGRVALVGDAAHAMSSALAWGMSSGIADAVCLSKVLTSDESVLQSLEKYDSERRPITQKYQRNSKGANRASLKR